MQVDKINGDVCYNDKDHVYWNKVSSKKYISVTTLIEHYTYPFEEEFWSLYKALERLLSSDEFKMEKKYLLETHRVDIKYFSETYDISEHEILSTQQDILDEWQQTNKESTERGTRIHSELEESFYKAPTCDLKKYGIGGKFHCKKNYFELDLDKGVYPEYMVYRESDDGIFNMAGQIDLLVKDGNDIYIFDYKTNKELKDKSYFDNRSKKYQMMKYPMTNLMDCNMMHYTLQLSTYAWMIQKINPDLNIKKLTLIHYGHDGKVKTHDIEYLKEDVERMLKDYKKQLIKAEQAKRRARIEY